MSADPAPQRRRGARVPWTVPGIAVAPDSIERAFHDAPDEPQGPFRERPNGAPCRSTFVSIFLGAHPGIVGEPTDAWPIRAGCAGGCIA